MKIIREKRKSLTLKIDKNGDLIIKSPHFLSQKYINDFVEKNKNWILEKQKNLKNNLFDFKIWKKVLFFWEEFEIIFDENKKIFFDNKNFYTNEKKEENLEKIFINFYKKQAKEYLTNRIFYISKKLNINFNNFRITSAKTRRWSCSSKKNINLSFRLILTSKNCIDYVIIHELSHLFEMNHSKKFWEKVDYFSKKIWILDYKIYKNKLKYFDEKINFVN